MYKRILCGFVLMLALSVVCAQAPAYKKRGIAGDAEQQTRLLMKEVRQAQAEGAKGVSPRTEEGGKLKLVESKDWTSGFFAGELWLLYQLTGRKSWMDSARIFTAPIEKEKTNAGTHDMGFKIYCSFGAGYRNTRDPHYKDVIIEAARTLSTRFNPKTGCIRSWDHHKEQWGYPVIIDNMMNLELLFAATSFTGDSSFYRIAVSHANTTMKNHYRTDYSSYHVVDYDTSSGAVKAQATAQGYADASAWARGQAWGLYGFTLCYRETHDPKYLQQAEHIAGFILNHPHMPKDLVPYWDYNDPAIPDAPRDASAAAITASALLELSTYSRNKKSYRETANRIMTNLINHYRAPLGSTHGFILLHSTGNKPSNSEIDVPINYADYYFLEAEYRRGLVNKGERLFFSVGD